MKKLALVIICSTIIIVLIAFNYLLWDRGNKEQDIETLQYSNANNSASINVLGREINNLEDENDKLTGDIKILESKNENLNKYNDELTIDKAKTDESLTQKKELINNLLQHVDLELLKLPINNWIQSINQQEYVIAFELYNAELSRIDFTSCFKDAVKKILTNSLELLRSELPENRKGDIVFKAVLNVEKHEDEKKHECLFEEGMNEVFFIMDYSLQKKGWVIRNMLTRLD